MPHEDQKVAAPRNATIDASTRARTSLKINRPTLHEEVANRLRDMILVGTLNPGEIIPELQLCAELGISRTPLREALKVLASESLVELQQGRGAVVVQPSSDDVKGILYAIGAIEGACALLACENISTREFQQIKQLHGRMVEAHQSDNRIKYFEFNQRIHEKIVAASRNAFLVNMHEKLNLRVRRIRFLGKQQLSWWDQAIAEHEEILLHLQKRDGPLLAEALRQHMYSTWNDIQHTLEPEKLTP
jgi:DNA-binding GntR family transcriptional regulator